MPKGGARPGAGRKKGPSMMTRMKTELAQKVAEQGVTPLEIMVTTMVDLWNEANAGERPNLSKRMQACVMAEKVAPYVHPKLATTQLNHANHDGGPLDPLTDEQRELLKRVTDDEY